MLKCEVKKKEGGADIVDTGRTKKFRDTIHGYIEIPEVIVTNIIDTEQFQRLRYIEQTSMRSLYPAARHDRFIHSLGVYWLGGQAFKYFRQNSQKELSDIEKKVLTDEWWDKQELLFSLACLLHDCAHAPFSHTLEALYVLRKITLKKGNTYGLDNNSKIAELDFQLVEVCRSDAAFLQDFLGKGSGALNYCGVGAPHEKMSSYCVMNEYSSAVKMICKELLGTDIVDEDIVFIVRMIIGCVYTETGFENSVKNCIISMLNSSSIDVDGLDYIVRDAYMSGIDNFSIDYQRLLSSFTIIPVEVYQNQKVRNANLDEIWLKGARFVIERFEAKMVSGKLTIENLDVTDKGNINGINEKVVVENHMCFTKSEDQIEVQRIESGIMQFEESCKLRKSKFSGTIEWGKRIISPLHPQQTAGNHQEYILGYDKNSLSIIQSTVEARNHEYLWVYTHPKVLYSSNYLQWELLRDSAKYLCCCTHNKCFDKEKLEFDCEKCEYSEKANKKGKNSEEDLLLYIMGYSTYFAKTDNGLDNATYKKLVKHGFVFYRTCDDDLNALFKRIFIENARRKNLKSDKLEADFKEFFSRNHRRPLWKSFVEYDNFLKLCEENADAKDVIPRFCKQVVSMASIYKNSYAEPSPSQQKIFKKYGITNVMVIKASVRTKELCPNETFIRFKDQILRLSDVFDKENRKERLSKDFYYIFANLEKDISKKELTDMVKELDS